MRNGLFGNARDLYKPRNGLFSNARDLYKPRKAQWDNFRALIRRLAEDPDGPQARAVLEVELLPFKECEEKIASDFEQEVTLATLVKALPNLRQFRSVSPDLPLLLSRRY
jgi:hypothetical protein